MTAPGAVSSRFEVAELVRHAANRIADRAKRITDPARRRRFLEAIPEHARLGELAAAD
ncbi:MAG: hypothetical protein L6Q84_01690 [Polyangiaceae bacterium]|nr:hypothetical protein [Polyangiaceae bacterium]